jgi:hypothetical protein
MLLRSFDFAFVCAVFGLSIWLWTVADGFPDSRRFAQIDTDYWPKHVFALLILVSGALLAQKLLAFWRTRGQPADASSAPEARAGDRVAALRIAAMLGLVIGYVFAFKYLGFALATLLFLWAGSFVMPYRNLIARLCFAPAFTLALTLFFSHALTLPLPRGTGPFYQLSVLLY